MRKRFRLLVQRKIETTICEKPTGIVATATMKATKGRKRTPANINELTEGKSNSQQSANCLFFFKLLLLCIKDVFPMIVGFLPLRN